MVLKIFYVIVYYGNIVEILEYVIEYNKYIDLLFD